VNWTVTIPGQPPSTNHAYKIVTVRRGTGGVPFRTLAKTDEAVTYQMAARLLVATARPSGWKPEAQVRLIYRLYLSRKQDADNSLKLLNDAIARALDINDDRFLPCVESKEIVKANPRVEVTIE
jgi:Holliday junction resolvase RusA-like endonuclease